MADFIRVKEMVMEAGLVPENIDQEEELFIVTSADRGFHNLVVDCEEEIIVLEMPIMPVTPATDYRKLLEMNNALVHGAFAVATDSHGGEHVVWRDTLQLAHLDPNELHGSLNALELALAEHFQALETMTSCRR